MTISNEPGYYEEGAFGIRIENICVTIDAKTENNFNGKRYCAMETVTLCPIKTSLIDGAMLTQHEVEWLDAYHAEVRQKLLPVMKDRFPEAVDYLLHETRPLHEALRSN
jgi:Xaa-Pro aminopeptidase